ncbi:MAG: winged helix-turn-helix domain-containing protein [Gammaproteobacteria bacterium]
MRPKAFRLLRYLAEHPQRLLTQEELLKAVWQHTYVNEGSLRGYIRELRGRLGDDVKAHALSRRRAGEAIVSSPRSLRSGPSRAPSSRASRCLAPVG